MLTFLAGPPVPTPPETLVRDGVTLYRKEVAAYNVREGDVIRFVDATSQTESIARVAHGVVDYVMSWPAGRGRNFTPEWRRREIHARDWRGDVMSFMLPTSPLSWAPRDRVLVWRPNG